MISSINIINGSVFLGSLYLLVSGLLLTFGGKMIKSRFRSYPPEYRNKKLLHLRLYVVFLVINAIVLIIVVLDRLH